MKRSRVAGGENLYSPDKEIEQLELELAKICFIAGIEFDQLEDTTIDDIFFNLRQVVHYSSPMLSNSGKPGFDVMRKQNYHLMSRARHCWYHRQIAIARKNNE